VFTLKTFHLQEQERIKAHTAMVAARSAWLCNRMKLAKEQVSGSVSNGSALEEG